MKHSKGAYNTRKMITDFSKFKDNIDFAIMQEKKFPNKVDEIIDNLGSNIGTLIEQMRKEG